MTPMALDVARLPPLVTPALTDRAASPASLRGKAATPRLARLAGLCEDVALIALAVYMLPLAILLVTTPIGLLIRLVMATFARG